MRTIIIDRDYFKDALNVLNENKEHIISFLNSIAEDYLYGDEKIIDIDFSKMSICAPTDRHTYPCLKLFATLDEGDGHIAGGIVFIYEYHLAWEEDNDLHPFNCEDDELRSKIRRALYMWYDYAFNDTFCNISMERINLC